MTIGTKVQPFRQKENIALAGDAGKVAPQSAV